MYWYEDSLIPKKKTYAARCKQIKQSLIEWLAEHKYWNKNIYSDK